ncbi:MAG: molybdopterin-binding protein, partial [Pseudomonadota bacterium]|nr:molybdopterin-binding protein [Pseudomonadota bacterium]
MPENTTKTAAILIIGNEILSGRTQDKNIQYIAERMTEIGVVMSEVRVVPDIPARISTAVRDLSDAYDYV